MSDKREKIVEIDLNAPVRRVEVGISMRLKLHLPEIPTTGFLWARTSPLPNGIAERNVEFRPGTGGIGAAGFRVFTYEFERPLSADVSFAQRRPWESDNPAHQLKIELVVTVE